MYVTETAPRGYVDRCPAEANEETAPWRRRPITGRRRPCRTGRRRYRSNAALGQIPGDAVTQLGVPVVVDGGRPPPPRVLRREPAGDGRAVSGVIPLLRDCRASLDDGFSVKSQRTTPQVALERGRAPSPPAPLAPGSRLVIEPMIVAVTGQVALSVHCSRRRCGDAQLRRRCRIARQASAPPASRPDRRSAHRIDW